MRGGGISVIQTGATVSSDEGGLVGIHKNRTTIDGVGIYVENRAAKSARFKILSSQ